MAEEEVTGMLVSNGLVYGILFGILAIIGLIVYFLPAVVAFKRNHTNKVAILVLDILLGWTFIGWVIALVWAFTGNTSANKQ